MWCNVTGVLGLLTTPLCNGDDNIGILVGGDLLLLFLPLVLNSNGWPRGGLLILLAPAKLLDNGVDDLLGVGNLLGAGGEDVLLTVEAFDLAKHTTQYNQYYAYKYLS